MLKSWQPECETVYFEWTASTADKETTGELKARNASALSLFT